MATLSIAAHNLDADFENEIAKDYGVTIVCTQGAPWTVIFEGEVANLKAMVKDHWGTDVYPDEHLDEMITL